MLKVESLLILKNMLKLPKRDRLSYLTVQGGRFLGLIYKSRDSNKGPSPEKN